MEQQPNAASIERGKRLRSHMDNTGYTVRTLARDCDLHAKTIQNIIVGKTGPVRYSTVTSITAAINARRKLARRPRIDAADIFDILTA